MLDKDISGTVFNVQKFSVHDGKGIRTLVFLKGCPLRCKWCSNPESQRFAPERAFNPSRCLSSPVCGRCVEACPSGALFETQGSLHYDRSKCVGCFACARACPSSAQSCYGETMTADQALRRVEEDSAFYARSGGGLTLSGGEPMAQPAFALALLREARTRHINTAMETCGHCDWNDLSQACALLNSLIFDVKSMDSARHRSFTGVDNELILTNFNRICEEFPNLPLLVRTPVIPGFNDTEADIVAIRDFVARHPRARYELLPYHRMGQPKYEYIGKSYAYEGVSLDEAKMQHIQALI